MVKLETRADTVAAHRIIVCHGKQVALVKLKHFAVKRRVVVVRQDEVLFVIAQFIGVGRLAPSFHIVCQEQICVENKKFHIVDDPAAISSENHQWIVHQIGLSCREEIEERI